MVTVSMPTPRNILSVELVAAANAVLNETAKRTGLGKKDLVARMCNWFADQDPEVQKVVLGEIPDSLAGAARELAIRRMRGVQGEKPGYDVVVGKPTATPPELPPAGEPSKRRQRQQR